MMRLLLAFVCFCLPHMVKAGDLEAIQNKLDQQGSRLLVVVTPGASFSPEDFALATSATAISVDARNPYIELSKSFLSEPYVVISILMDDLAERKSPSLKALRKLAQTYGYRYVVFKEESLEEAVARATHLRSVIPTSTSEIASLTEEESKKLYVLMGQIDQILTTNGVKYWAGRETLLGAILCQGLLPWDDYLHLYILDTDEKALQNLEAEFEKAGLVLHVYSKELYKIHAKDGFVIENIDKPGEVHPFCYPAANIFVMTLEKRKEIEDFYVHKSYDFYFHWNHDRFAYPQIANVHRVAFGPITIAVPGDPESHLHRLFGTPQYPDLWKKYIIEPVWDHRREARASYPGAALIKIDQL